MIRRTRHGSWRWAVAGILLGSTLCLASCTAAISDTDIEQERLDTASPPLDGSHTLAQSFTAQHDNLHEIEVLPAVYGTPGQGALHLQLRPRGLVGASLAEQRVDAAAIGDAVPIRFAFAALADSRGREYELHVQGEPGLQVGLWYNSVNAYGPGRLTLDEQNTAGDLRFVTRYRYDWRLALRDGIAVLQGHAWLLLPLLVLLLVPGYALCRGLIVYDDPLCVAALSLASSLAAVPVVLLWSTVFNLRWNRTLCVLTFSALAVWAALRWFRRQRKRRRAWKKSPELGIHLAVIAILAATLLLRLLQIRNLVLPAWVDSPQHALVTDLISTHGRVPSSYQPFLPVERFIYHFGFHALNCAFHWLSGLAIPQAMLWLGQFLNAASSLMAYALTVRLTQRRAAGVMAALVTGLVSYMPAYYVSWGRYTQLTGLLLLSGATVATLEWLEAQRWDARSLALATLLQGGLILTHARVAVFGACFVASYVVFETLSALRGHSGAVARRLWVRAAALAGMVLLLSGPWLLQVLRGLYTALQASGSGLQDAPSYNAFPWALLLVPRNRQLIVLAALGAVLGLAQRRKQTLWLLGGCSLVALVVNPSWLGLPIIGFLNNASALISLFVPLAVLVGQAFAGLWDAVPARLSMQFKADLRAAVRTALALLAAAAGLWGAYGMITIVNPATVLATADDLSAMSWISENTPSDAVFVINARHWQLGTFAGTDGGYWIPQLTGRRTLVPDLSYSYGDPSYVQHIGQNAQRVAELQDARDPGFVALLQEEGITHIYLGAKGGPLTPQMFLSNASYREVYNTGAVWIFEVAP